MLQLTFSWVILNLYYKFLKVEKLDQTVRHTSVCVCMCILKIAFHRDSIQLQCMKVPISLYTGQRVLIFDTPRQKVVSQWF